MSDTDFSDEDSDFEMPLHKFSGKVTSKNQ